MAKPTTADFEITTSIRSDKVLELLKESSLDVSAPRSCQFYILRRHQDRMLAALLAFNWPQTLKAKISNLQDHLHAHLASTYGDSTFGNPLKMRVTLSSSGDMDITSAPVATVGRISLFPSSLSDLLEPLYAGIPPTFRVFLSPAPTKPDQFTIHKTTQRTMYDEIRSYLPPHPSLSAAESMPAEVLLINRTGEIMEGSITTPYFYRGGAWITPAASCGGNMGTTRRFALETDLCEEGVVLKSSVSVGEKVVLSNGVRGFGWGTVEDLPM